MDEMNDREQEYKLQELFDHNTGAELAVEDYVSIDPWRHSVYSILWGFGLTMITLNFWYLDFILTTVGTALLLYGFGALRQQNRLFKTAWAVSVFKAAIYIPIRCLSASPFLADQVPLRQEAGYYLGIFLSIVTLIQILIFRAGLNREYRENSIFKERDPLLWTAVWYACVLILATFGLEIGIITGLILVLLFILSLRSLSKVAKQMDKLGFVLRPATVRLRRCILVTGYTVLSGILLISVIILSSHILPGAQVMTAENITDLRQELTKLGFPKHILADIPENQLSEIEDPVRVEYWTDEYIFDNSDKLNMETVYVETEDRELIMIQYFCWLRGSPRWSDGIYAWYSDSLSIKNRLIGAGLLYDKDGVSYIAPIPELQYGYLAEKPQNISLTGAVRYPLGAENRRGYIMMGVTYEETVIFIGASLDYYHAMQPDLTYKNRGTQAMLGLLQKEHGQNYTNYEFR